MNLTITPLNNNKYKQNRNIAFTSKLQTAEQMIRNEGTKGSGLFKPFEKKYDEFTTTIAEKFTSKIVNWSFVIKLADALKNSKNLYQHCLTLGSVITSGLYMQRTYTNKSLDEDRRNTLVVNQGLTLMVSTAGAYALDGSMKNWWDNLTARFAGHLIGDKDFHSNFLNDKAKIKKENKVLKANNPQAELKPLPDVLELVKVHKNYKDLSKIEKGLIHDKIKGMGLLKSMLVFGFVYRFFVPVAVTKPANKLCERYLENKKAKQENIKTVA